MGNFGFVIVGVIALDIFIWVYENLHLADRDRNIIDDLIFCIISRSERVEQLAYYAGASDTLEFINQ